jgi:TonB family protein
MRAKRQEYAFWLGLASATILHAALIFGVAGSSARIVGEHDGEPDALSVDIVDAASLSGPGVPPRQQQEAATQTRPSAAERAAQPSSPWIPDTQALMAFPLFGTDDGSAKHPSQPNHAFGGALKLDPPDSPMLGTGRDATVGRPPNITRSGENDEFGRGVVRALRRTMPSPSGVNRRVTIRLVLSETGNLVNIALVRSSGDQQFDQSIMFAARQSSFPIPPAGSTLSDRLFLVTYIYRDATKGHD